jgi:hypothetical protein
LRNSRFNRQLPAAIDGRGDQLPTPEQLQVFQMRRLAFGAWGGGIGGRCCADGCEFRPELGVFASKFNEFHRVGLSRNPDDGRGVHDKRLDDDQFFQVGSRMNREETAYGWHHESSSTTERVTARTMFAVSAL